jgi:hypothetical protein
MLDKQGYIHVRACTRSHFRAHTLTRAHAHQYVIFIAFPQQQWLRERASILRYKYIICLVLVFIGRSSSGYEKLFSPR